VETCEDLDPVTGDERQRATFDRLRHGRGQALARRDRRVPLMERPRHEGFRDASTVCTEMRVASAIGRFA
jgi:hypothetical protein